MKWIEHEDNPTDITLLEHNIQFMGRRKYFKQDWKATNKSKFLFNKGEFGVDIIKNFVKQRMFDPNARFSTVVSSTKKAAFIEEHFTNFDRVFKIDQGEGLVTINGHKYFFAENTQIVVRADQICAFFITKPLVAEVTVYIGDELVTDIDWEKKEEEIREFVKFLHGLEV